MGLFDMFEMAIVSLSLSLRCGKYVMSKFVRVGELQFDMISFFST